MGPLEKEAIKNLHKRGWSVNKIADSMNLSKNTVKSFLWRLSKEEGEPKKETKNCAYCGAELPYTPGGRERRFCSDKCRTKYWNKERANEPYKCICKNCHKEFVSFGNKKKAFCSKECRENFNSGKEQVMT